MSDSEDEKSSAHDIYEAKRLNKIARAMDAINGLRELGAAPLPADVQAKLARLAQFEALAKECALSQPHVHGSLQHRLAALAEKSE